MATSATKAEVHHGKYEYVRRNAVHRSWVRPET